MTLVTRLFNLEDKCFIILISLIQHKINSTSGHFYRQSKGYIKSSAEGMIIKFSDLSSVMTTLAKKMILVVVALFRSISAVGH